MPMTKELFREVFYFMLQNNDESPAADWILNQLYDAVANKPNAFDIELEERAAQKFIEEYTQNKQHQQNIEKLQEMHSGINKMTPEEYSEWYKENYKKEDKHKNCTAFQTKTLQCAGCEANCVCAGAKCDVCAEDCEHSQAHAAGLGLDINKEKCPQDEGVKCDGYPKDCPFCPACPANHRFH